MQCDATRCDLTRATRLGALQGDAEICSATLRYAIPCQNMRHSALHYYATICYGDALEAHLPLNFNSARANSHQYFQFRVELGFVERRHGNLPAIVLAVAH